MKLRLGKPTGGEILSASGVMFFAAFLALDQMGMPEAERMAVALESELGALAPPPGARMLGDISRMVKPSGVVISKRYALSSPEPATVDHFRHQFTNRGWSPCPSNASAFCKDAFQATIEVERSASNVEMWVVLTWH